MDKVTIAKASEFFWCQVSGLHLLIWLLLFSFPQEGYAYIPSYKVIMSRLAENHGRGIYQFYQDVVCPSSPEPYVIREIWTVLSEDSMRVTISGKGQLKGLVSGSIVYRGDQKYFRGTDKRVKFTKPGKDWTEPFFHFRFSKNMKPKVVALGMAPAKSLESRLVSIRENKRREYEDQEFLRLARVDGRVAYAIGRAADPQSSRDLPTGLWIEQDRFNVLRIRMPSGASISADNYQPFENDLSFPRQRVYQSGDFSCEAQVEKVVSRSRRAPYLKILDPKSLAEDEKAKPFALPEIQVLREFYSRFR